MQQAARGHFVARLGGDEFVVLQSVGGTAMRSIASREILVGMAQPFSIDGNEFVPSTSIAIARTAKRAARCSAMRLALYRAKEAGRGTFAFFEESLNERVAAPTDRNRSSPRAGARRIRTFLPAIVRS